MKPTIENLKSTFDYSSSVYEKSIKRYELVLNMFNNKQYTRDEMALLLEQGRPAETFNIIKLFTRQISGYYDAVTNTTRVDASHPEDVKLASILNDIIKHIDYKSSIRTINQKLRLDLLLGGLAVSELRVVKSVDDFGNIKTDKLGRIEYDIFKEHVPINEIRLDPMSKQEDYSDARFIHRYKWTSREEMEDMFGKAKVDKLQPHNSTVSNSIISNGSDEHAYNISDLDNFLVVRTIIKHKKKTYSVYWCNDTILSKTVINHKIVKFPYQVVKLQDTIDSEFFGIFEDIIETQRAINQALLQIQLMVNTNKVIVRTGAIKEDEWEDFKNTVTRVNAIIEIDDPQDITILNMNGDIAQQYRIIDEGFNRIKRVLGVNDSFLGQAFASDSGRKVKLQQNSTISSLKYIDIKLELLYTLIGKDLVGMIKQYYRSNRIIRISDEVDINRWIEINKPLVNPENGQFMFHEEIDPDTGRLLKDSNGNFLLTPLNDADTDISFLETDIKIIAVSYNDEDERNQLMLETMLNGNIGAQLMQYNPAGYLKASSLIVKTMKTKHSMKITEIIEQTADMISNQGEQQGQEFQDSPKSSELKLPQNTNEGY